MKRLLTLLICGAFLSSNGFSQDLNEEINALKAPSSPASIILGVQPSSFLYPKSQKALEATLLSNFVDDNNEIVVPDDFGVEFSPYWFNDHGLTVEEYLYSDDLSAYLNQLWRNSSFSIATTQNFVLEDSSVTNAIGLGYRTTLHFSSQADKSSIDTYRTRIKAAKKISTRIIAQAEKIDFNDIAGFVDQMSGFITETLSRAYGAGNEQKAQEQSSLIIAQMEALEYNGDDDTLLDSFNSMVSGAVVEIESGLTSESLVTLFKDYIKQRNGLSVDLGYAVLLNFPANTFEDTYAPKRTLWLTPGFRFKNEDWSFLKILGVYRNTQYDLGYYKTYFPGQEVFQSSEDFGLAATGEFDKLSFRIEFLSRTSKTETPTTTGGSGTVSYTVDEKSDFQSIGTISYRLNKDIVLTYSLGESFDEVLSNNNIVSLLTLNFGLGGLNKESLK